MHLKILLLTTSVLMLTMIISCDKDNITKGHEILEIIKTKEPGLQELVKSRLAFAKIVSIAFCNTEFRTYFKNNFGTKSQGGNYFEECLLLKNQHDKVLSNGTSLIDFLRSIREEEVDCIYNGQLIDQLLKKDKQICIKLPDLFLDYDWNIDHAAPVVIATYPERYANNIFLGYHYNNGSKFYLAGEIPQVLHVYIKGSEDYAIVDIQSLTDKFGNHINQYLPQLDYCNGLLDEIIGISEIKGKEYIVNLKLAYKIWFNKYSYKGNYFKDLNCQQTCPRDCEIPPNTNYILENMKIADRIFYKANTDLVFRESAGIYFQFFDKQQSIQYNDFVIPNLHYSELGRKFDISGTPKKISKIPTLSIRESNEIDSKIQQIKYLISSGIKTNIYFNITLLQYGDIYYKKRILNLDFTNPFNPENALLLGSSVFLYCDSNEINSNSGEVDFLFKY